MNIAAGAIRVDEAKVHTLTIYMQTFLLAYFILFSKGRYFILERKEEKGKQTNWLLN